MKIAGIIVLMIGIIGLVGMIIAMVGADNQYNNQIYNYWSLADKSSTIEAKADYVDKFVGAIDNAHLGGNNALIYKNPDNSFEFNFQAVKTLQQRLQEIKTMDPNSFEYQQAISQITQQEQGEAQDMLGVLEGIWYKQNHLFLWSYIGGLVFFGWILLGFIGGVIIGSDDSY